MARFKTWDISPPHGYVARAKSFATAARLLHKHQKSDFTPYLVCVGHATEVALKGLLVLKGVKEKTLPKNPGHDLVKGWLRAFTLGATISPDPPQWCELVNVQHSHPYDARYPRANKLIGLPDPLVTLAGLDQLIDTVEETVKRESVAKQLLEHSRDR